MSRDMIGGAIAAAGVGHLCCGRDGVHSHAASRPCLGRDRVGDDRKPPRSGARCIPLCPCLKAKGRE
jgi:hypothetical protein